MFNALHTGMKVIRHAGVDSRMIIMDDQARQQMNLPFNAIFRLSRALSGIQRLNPLQSGFS